MNELVELNTDTAMAIFIDQEKLAPYIDQVKNEVNEFKHDLSNPAGRKKTASLAAKVAKVKVRMDALGKELVSGWKSKAKIVDSSRKSLRDELDELKIIARQPLTDWEDEQKKIEAEKLEVEKLEQLKKEIDNDYEMALLLDEKFERQKIEAAESARKIKEDYEIKLKKEAVEAEKKASAEREMLANQAVIDAIETKRLALEREKQAVEREKLAEERVVIERKENVKRENAAKKLAEAEKILAAESAIKSLLAKHKQTQELEKEESDKRAKNKKLKTSVNNKILDVLVENGLSSMHSKTVIRLIIKGELPNITIKY